MNSDGVLPQALVIDGCRDDRLTNLLRQPAAILRWDEADWDLAIRQARQAGLLARIGSLIDESGMIDRVPPAPLQHLLAARIFAEKHVRDVEREVDFIDAALARIDVPIILLKGAAYVLAALPAARGRLFADIDILVPAAVLPAVEAALVAQGWQASVDDAYDQAYYRRWMHEIPPLQHRARRTSVDVHHTIVPPTAGLTVNADLLFAAAVPLDGGGRLKCLGSADLVLHSAVHLFNEGEFVHGLRDLDDLNRLLRYFAADAGFWDHLIARAAVFRLERPLYFALRYAAAILATPVPPEVLDHPLLAQPGRFRRAVMDALFIRALRPQHATCTDRASGIALAALYVRSHYLRMPLRLLLPHLLRKALVHRRPVAAT